MNASQYPVTTEYGWVKDYPLNLDPVGHPGKGLHRGEDRYMPLGTPVIVNGLVIGLSGNTGAVTGPHLHIGKFIAGHDVSPQGGGFDLTNAYVYDTGYDATNGNFVRISSGGVLWVYLHLSKIMVTKGQRIEGATMDVEDLKKHVLGLEEQVDQLTKLLVSYDIVGRFEDVKANVIAIQGQVDKLKPTSTAPIDRTAILNYLSANLK